LSAATERDSPRPVDLVPEETRSKATVHDIVNVDRQSQMWRGSGPFAGIRQRLNP
jgi:hypothetical protein